jgi:hypothetical protein
MFINDTTKDMPCHDCKGQSICEIVHHFEKMPYDQWMKLSNMKFDCSDYERDENAK